MIKVSVNNLQKNIKIPSKKFLSRVVREVLHREGYSQEIEIDIVFCTDEKIRELNKKYLNRDETTDVLAFSMKENFDFIFPPILGEIIISIETAQRQAKRYNSTLFRETTLLLTHGILHLLGYTDEKSEERKKMQKRQNSILRNLRPLLQDICNCSMQKEVF